MVPAPRQAGRKGLPDKNRRETGQHLSSENIFCLKRDDDL